MQPSLIEKKLSNFFCALFNIKTLPSWLFVIFCTQIPLLKLYFLITPYPFILIFIIIFFFTFVIPFLWQRYLRKQNMEVSQRELLICSLILNCITLVFLRQFSLDFFSTIILNSFIITILLLIIMIIESFFIQISTYSTATLIIALVFITDPYKISFVYVSIVLLLAGFLLSLFVVNQKSTLKQTLIAFISTLVTTCIYLLLPW
jgi:hypothetical protein